MEKTLSGIGHATFSLPLQAPKPWLQDVPERLAQQIETAHRYLGRASRHCQESRSWCTWATYPVTVHPRIAPLKATVAESPNTLGYSTKTISRAHPNSHQLHLVPSFGIIGTINVKAKRPTSRPKQAPQASLRLFRAA